MSPTGLLITGLAIIKFIFPFLLQSAVYEPHRDEFCTSRKAITWPGVLWKCPPCFLYLRGWYMHAGTACSGLNAGPLYLGHLNFIMLLQELSNRWVEKNLQYCSAFYLLLQAATCAFIFCFSPISWKYFSGQPLPPA